MARVRFQTEEFIPSTKYVYYRGTGGELRREGTVLGAGAINSCIDEMGGNLVIYKVRYFPIDVPMIAIGPRQFNNFRGTTDVPVPVYPIRMPQLTRKSEANVLNDFASNLHSMKAYGASAIASAWPTNPTAEAATFIAELAGPGGLPSLPGRALASRKRGAVSGEFLNYQFGIKPILSDIEKFREAATTADSRLVQLRRDSGKPVSRRRTGPEKTSLESSSSRVYPGLNGLPGFQTYDYELGDLTTITKRTTRDWFSGKFTYHIPDRSMSPAFVDMLDKARYSWGAVPGINTAWELTPFSWAVDYFSNTGEVVTNLQRLAEGNRVYDAYAMRHITEETQYTWTGNVSTRNGMQKISSTLSLTREWKMRVRAHPFGFGVLDSDITPMQVALLAAVGRQQTL